MARMEGQVQDTAQTLALLRSALEMPGLAPRVARNCERLVERLSKPVRVGLFGFALSDRAELLRALLGADLLPGDGPCPTLQVIHGTAPRSTATLADASRVTVEGLPDAGLMAMEPVFLKVAAPFDVLQRMSFLLLAAGDEVTEQAPALAWAAKRTDVSIWCTHDFDAIEAQVWAAAPERLKNHAHLAVFGGADAAETLRGRALSDFESVVAVPQGPDGADATRLLARLGADIDTALGEDMDAARLLLHRFGLDAAPDAAAAGTAPAEPAPTEDAVTAPPEQAAPEQAAPAPAADTRQPAADPALAADRIALLSEPILYLKRRTRNLFETLEWQDDSTEGWVSDLLEHCCETADGLRDRAAAWPEDDAEIIDLREMIDEASDMAVLLQVEGGPDQAQDATAMLCQLRTELEGKLPAALPLAC